MYTSGEERKCKERPCCSFRRVTRIKMQIHPLHYNTQKMNNNVTLHRANLLKSSSQTMSTTRYTRADAADAPLRGREDVIMPGICPILCRYHVLLQDSQIGLSFDT